MTETRKLSQAIKEESWVSKIALAVASAAIIGAAGQGVLLYSETKVIANEQRGLKTQFEKAVTVLESIRDDLSDKVTKEEFLREQERVERAHEKLEARIRALETR